MTESEAPFVVRRRNRRGDDGTTGLLFGGPRVAKDDPRTEAYGTIDEAVAALGIARAELGVKDRLGTLNAGARPSSGEVSCGSSASCSSSAPSSPRRPTRWDRLRTAARASRPRWSTA